MSKNAEYLKRKQAKATARRHAARLATKKQAQAEARARFDAAVQAGQDNARLHPKPTQAELIANPEKYGAVQQFSKETWERTASALTHTFNTPHGFLCSGVRDVVYELILQCQYMHAGTIAKLARDFTSNRPTQRWCSLFDFKEEESIRRGADLHLFRKGRAAFVKEFGREFARYLVQERRAIRREREGAMLYCLLLIANASEVQCTSTQVDSLTKGRPSLHGYIRNLDKKSSPCESGN